MLGKDDKNNEDDFEIEPMMTKDSSFALDLNGKQCGKLQYVRELTQNSIEAIQVNVGNGGNGDILWTYDEEEFKASGVYKLCIIDNGPGMTGEELRTLMNHMYSSGKNQTVLGNFGIGAKVAALYRSPRGLIYKSFKNGKGVFGELVRKESTGEYGLRQQDEADGSLSPYLPIPLWKSPDLIKNNGTMVTLIGKEENEDTFTSPEEGEYGVAWLSRYLNSRYFTLPEGINMKVRKRVNPNDLENPKFSRRKIAGMKNYLDKYQTEMGMVEVNGAKMYWWVLEENYNPQSHFNHCAHTGTLFQNEIYDLEIYNRRNRQRLNKCGIIHLINRVVIYAEPTSKEIFSDPSRTNLLVEGGKKAPWYKWAEEFSNKLPIQIQKLEEEASEKASDKDINIQAYDILKKWLADFQIPKYSKNQEGDLEVSPPIDIGGLPESGKTSIESNEKVEKSKNSSGPRGKRYSDFIQDNGDKGKNAPVSDYIPSVDWVTPEIHPHLEDRAAQYIRERNKLLINSDFRGYLHLIEDVFQDKASGKPGARSIVEEQCKLGWQIHLCEAVMRVQNLKKGGRTWNQSSIDSALSEESLTAHASGTIYLNKSIKKSVSLAISKTSKKIENELLIV